MVTSLSECGGYPWRFRPLSVDGTPMSTAQDMDDPLLPVDIEDILDGLHAQAVFQGARDRIPDEFGLRREALFLGRRHKQLRLLFRKFEAYCLHTDCNTVVLLSSTDGPCESEDDILRSLRLEP